MGYVPCNEEMQEVLEMCAFAEAEDGVDAPWLCGTQLTGEGRSAAIVAIDCGLLGLAKSSGGKYRFYSDRNQVGNWQFELWPAWKACAVLALLSVAGLMAFMLRADIAGKVALVLIGLALVGVFHQRAKSLPVHWALAAAVARPGYGSAVVPAAFGVALGVEMVLAGGLLVAGFELPGEVIDVPNTDWGMLAGAAGSAVLGISIALLPVSRAIWTCVLKVLSIRGCAPKLLESSYFTMKAQEAAQIDGMAQLFDSARSWHSVVFVLLICAGLSLAAWPLLAAISSY